MAEPSSARSRPVFSRGRLVVGIVIVAVIGAGVAYVLGRSRPAPDPGRLVYATKDAVFVRDLATGEIRRLSSIPESLTALPSPDGRWVAYYSATKQTGLVELATGRVRALAEADRAIPFGWTPDARVAYVALGADIRLIVIDPDGAKEVLATRFGETHVVWIDDTRFVSQHGSKELVLVDTGEEETSVETLVDDAMPLAVSPDDKEILYVAKGDLIVAKLAGDRLTSKRVIVRKKQIETKGAAVSPSGVVAVFGTSRKRDAIWLLASGEPLRVGRGKVQTAAWSQDGSALVYAVGDEVYAYETGTRERKRLTPRGTKVIGLAVVP